MTAWATGAGACGLPESAKSQHGLSHTSRSDSCDEGGRQTSTDTAIGVEAPKGMRIRDEERDG